MQKYPSACPYLVAPDGDAGLVRDSLVTVGQATDASGCGEASICLSVDDADRAHAGALQAGAPA